MLSASSASFSAIVAFTSRSSFDCRIASPPTSVTTSWSANVKASEPATLRLLLDPALALAWLSAYDFVSFVKIKSGTLVPMTSLNFAHRLVFELSLCRPALAPALSEASSLAKTPMPVA